MNERLMQQAVALTEGIMRTYYSERDIYKMLSYMAPEATWIGPGEREKKYTLEDMKTYFELGKDAIPSCEVTDPDLHAVSLGEDLCLVTGSLTIRTTPESKLILEVDQRLSFILRYTDGMFQVVHMHTSNPYGEMKHDEYFPNEIGAQSYQYLQRLLREKSAVIDMINSNITGGLKGSNDDDTFSYFYVNEGLPRMLGYTYDEFMEKTGGTAVGSAYPPDLPAALADCARCFAKGPIYSTEYRMEKKDGTLMWVLDSGRKALDSEGIMRINSIITDITPLKQALFDLELERERYRIALENITGSMCEYDIARDIFTVFRQTAQAGGQGVEKLEFARFSESVRSGVAVLPEDGELLLDICTGKHSGPMEFRTCAFHPEGAWCWDQFSCSVLYDATGMPVRAIGILKDITEEKQENMKLLNRAQRDGLTQLLNQTAVKEAIQSYLIENSSNNGEHSALLMVDLDHFKEVNDSNGHLYGNDVLVKTARILEEVAGAGNLVGRSGGDEFIALLKETKPEEAARLAEVIVERVNKMGSDINFSITCSVGIACQIGKEESFSQFFRRADKALYRAKDSGRNCWAMDGEGTAGR